MTIDPLFRVNTLYATPDPNRCIFRAMHQDYSERAACEEAWCPAEPRAGAIVIDRLLAGGRGHYGPLEHPQITLSCAYFPHSVMQQARTHRVGVSFDVQSMRYTGERMRQALADDDLESVIYFRPVGTYHDRNGSNYDYSQIMRDLDYDLAKECVQRYVDRIDMGMAEEHARGLLPFDFRQHFVVSFTLRALLHFLDLRAKADAQLEIRQLCDLMLLELESWTPEIANWYRTSRLGKARLAP